MSRLPVLSPIHNRILASGLALICAATLLYLGVPRMVAGFLAQPGERVLARIAAGDPVERADLEALARSRQRAAGWVDDGRLKTQLGLARLRLYLDRPEGEPADPALLDQAIAAYRQGLANVPADRAAWAWLALAELQKAGPSGEVTELLRMSLLTGNYDPQLVFLRLELAFRLWPYFTPEDRLLILGQAQIAWKVDPKRLLRVAKDPTRLGIVRAALAASPGQLAKFEKLRRNPSAKPPRRRARPPSAAGGNAPAGRGKRPSS